MEWSRREHLKGEFMKEVFSKTKVFRFAWVVGAQPDRHGYINCSGIRSHQPWTRRAQRRSSGDGRVSGSCPQALRIPVRSGSPRRES